MNRIVTLNRRQGEAILSSFLRGEEPWATKVLVVNPIILALQRRALSVKPVMQPQRRWTDFRYISRMFFDFAVLLQNGQWEMRSIVIPVEADWDVADFKLVNKDQSPSGRLFDLACREIDRDGRNRMEDEPR